MQKIGAVLLCSIFALGFVLMSPLNSLACETGKGYFPKADNLVKGTKSQRNKARALIYASHQFKEKRKQLPLDKHKMKIQFLQHHDSYAMARIPFENDKDMLVGWLIYGVNLKTKKVAMQKTFYFKKLPGDKTFMKVTMNGTLIGEITMTKDGQVITPDGKTMTIQQYIQSKKEEKQSSLQPMGIGGCDYFMAVLCATGTFIACDATCADWPWQVDWNFGWWISCPYVCGLLWAIGCVEATARACH